MVDKIFVCVFIALLTVPAVVHLAGGDEDLQYIRQNERRKPGALPSSLDWKKLPGQLEQYVNDRFGFRRQLIEMYDRVHLAYGMSSSPSVLLGKDGWMFFTKRDVIDDYRGVQPLSEAAIAGGVAKFKRMRAFMRAKGVKTVFMLVPDKQSVYPDYLPDWATKVGPSCYEQMLAALRRTDLNVLDLRPALRVSRKWLPTFYRTDTHWNQYGAYVGYVTLMNRIRALFPEAMSTFVSPAQIRFTKKTIPGKDLARILYSAEIVKDTAYVPSYTRHQLDITLRKNGHRQAMTPWWKGTSFESVVRNTTGNGLRLLMLRNSFAIDMIPYLADTFDLSVFTGKAVDIEGLVDKYMPDVFVWLILERNL